MIRIKVDRRTEDETTTINQVLKKAKVRGQYKVTYFDKKGPHSYAVANIQTFLADLKQRLTHIAKARGGLGFAEIVTGILKDNG